MALQINNNVIFRYMSLAKGPSDNKGTVRIIEEEILAAKPISRAEVGKLIGVSLHCGCNGCDFLRYQNRIYVVKIDKKSKKIKQAVNFFLTL